MKKSKVILVSGLLIFFVVLTILVVLGLTKGFDDSVYSLVRSLESGFFDKYFLTVTKLGNESVVVILVFILLFIVKRNDKLLVVLSGIVSGVSNQLIKHIIMRDRPSVFRMIKQGGFSYPSGHSMIAVSLYGVLIYLVFKYIKNKYIKYGLSTILVLLIISIGISRIYVGVHFATDVIGGFTLAIVEVILIISFLEKKLRGN